MTTGWANEELVKEQESRGKQLETLQQYHGEVDAGYLRYSQQECTIDDESVGPLMTRVLNCRWQEC